MRTIPGMVIINPADDVEARAAVKAAAEYVGPVYLRFGRMAVPVFNDEATYKFEIGKGILLREGTDVTIVATGLCVNSALEAAEKLAADGISAEVTVEEHSVIGGLGSAVCDVLSEKLPTPVKKLGVNDTYCESGPAAKLVEKYRLDGTGVYEQTKEFL